MQSYPSNSDYISRPPHPERLEGGLRIRGEFHKKSRQGKPLVSVITVVFNGGNTLEQTIQSVLNQTYDNIEYIIIDGGSTDGTLDILRKYDDRIAYWISEPDDGIYDAMNKGISVSSGALINLLNADDYLESAAVNLVANKYTELNHPSVIYGHAYAVDDIHSVRAKMFASSKYWLGMSINHQSMFVHEKIYNATGLFNTNYRFAADYDFLIRCFKNKVIFSRINGCLVNYRNAGISARDSKYRHEANLINRKYFGRLSGKRIAFIIFNFLWMPFKLNFRTLLYRTVGVRITRNAITMYKKLMYRS